MIPRLTPAKKLLIIVGIQFLVLLSVIGFKQYAVWTGETVLLKTTPIDPRDLLRGDFVAVEYQISTIDLDKVAQDDAYGGRGAWARVRGHRPATGRYRTLLRFGRGALAQ